MCAKVQIKNEEKVIIVEFFILELSWNANL